MLHVCMCLATELLGPLTTLFNTWKVTKLFPKAAVPLYILTSSTHPLHFFQSCCLVLSLFLAVSVSMDVKDCFTVVVICIVEHLFMCLLAICISSLDKSIQSLSNLTTGFFFFELLVFVFVFSIQDKSPLSDIRCVNTVLHSVSYLFTTSWWHSLWHNCF